MFTLNGEARLLFADLEALSREATLYQFKEVAKLDCAEIRFVTVEESIVSLQARDAGTAAVHRLFHCSPEFAAAWLRFPVRVPLASEPAAGEGGLDGNKEEPVFWEVAEKARLHFCARTIRDAGVKVKAASFRLRDDGVEAVRSEQAASERELTVKMASLNEAVEPVIAAIERAAGSIWENDPTLYVLEDGTFFTGEVRDLWRLAGALSQSFDDILRTRWLISAREVVRSNLRFFSSPHGHNLLDELEANAGELVERIRSRIGCVVLEGGEASPTAPLVQSLISRDRRYGKAGLDGFLRHTEAVRTRVLYRLAHFTMVYKSIASELEGQAAEHGI